jgi:hypothetical protein
VVLLLGACTSHNQGNSAAGFKTEIPTDIFGAVDIFYQTAKDRQQQLGLDSLENGSHDLQIRVWYNFSSVKDRKLVIITNKDNNWTAAVYDFQVDRTGETETMLSKKIRQASPKSGWQAFSKKLLDLKTLMLPNQDDVEGYSAGDGGTTYSVEVATKKQYRFYNYWQPQEYQNRFWQAKNMTEMLQLFETELGN